ncbi:unnamed protein product [Rotaria magnacalcarata]|nr:unnamed protein product [Rotaria magnacalcarata]CAF2045349.1 unnamed protein product [Rotaria magnacalcarata]
MRKSKVTETNSSDDVVYSIDSDLSDIDMDNNVERDIPNIQQQESWSGKKLTSNMPYYEGESELSNDFESKIPRNPSSSHFFLLYYTSELVSYIVDQSNLYRIQTNKYTASAHDRRCS